MSKFKVTEGDKIVLEQMHREIKDGRKRDKIKALLFLDRGFSYVETSDLLMLDRDTIGRIEKKFKKDGIDKFLETDYMFYSGKLSDEQEKNIEEFVNGRYVGDSKEIVDFIKKEFNINYTVNGVTKLLHRIGFTYKKTKLVPAKADKVKQEAHIEMYKTLKENLKETEKIFFMDGVHPMHNATNGYCWIKKGTEKEIKSNTGRNRINLNGAYCTETQEVTIVTSDMINAQSTIELYTKIEERYLDLETIYIVRDNARYYNCNLVKEYLKTSRIKEIALPPYSPNLNPIERLWKYFKKSVTSNKYYETFSEFKSEVEYFFGEGFSEHKKELSTAVTDNMRAIQA